MDWRTASSNWGCSFLSIREIVYTSFKDDTLLHSYPYQALKWLIYQKWDQSAYRNTLPEFECPSCGKLTTLVFDADEGDSYIKTRVQSRADDGAAYGQDTNYGAKVFFKHSEYHSMVLNLPTGIKPGQLPQPTAADIIGFDRIAATLPGLLSQRFEGALLPVELANDLASLATYPSVQVFQMFSEKT
jgi:hypothetical protein